ncbi:MAG: T9SS type A sorting domain-containing protein [Bacteroidetes bacterium]|nr:T9SS type A sorting domain-containing protein [Bacteroidota bacterium]
MKKLSGLILLFLLLFFHSAKSTTWMTKENGNWADSSIWLSGVMPAYSTNDTILIRDTVYFDESIYLNAGAFMQIDSLGGALCGHHNIYVYSGARFHKNGALNVDSLYISGGTVDFIIGGPFLMWYAKVSNGGYFKITAYLSYCMCPWDTCFIPILPVDPIDTTIYNSYTVFPNPSNGNFELKYEQNQESAFNFYNIMGQLIFTKTLEGTSGLIHFNFDYMPNGAYIWETVSKNTVNQKGKHLIIN